jgi:hypothetical protein
MQNCNNSAQKRENRGEISGASTGTEQKIGLQSRSLHGKLNPTCACNPSTHPMCGRLIRLESDGDQMGSCAMSGGERTIQKDRCDFRPGYLHTFVRLRLLAWYFQDLAMPATDIVLDRVAQNGAVVPALWRLELANGLQSAVRRGRITAAYRDDSLADLGQMRIETDAETDVHA